MENTNTQMYRFYAALLTLQGGVEEIEVAVVADSFIRGSSTYDDTNYGSETTLVVKKASTDEFTRLAYLRFDLSALASIGTAILRVYGSSDVDAYVVSVFGTEDDGWHEVNTVELPNAGITWGNAPGSTTAALASATVNITAGFHDFDVSGYVKTQFAENKLVTLILKDASNQNKQAIFHSKENTSTNHPKLITTVAAAGSADVPAAPVLAEITVNASNDLVLSWTEGLDGGSAKTGNKIQVKGGGVFQDLVANTGNTLTTYTDTTQTEGSTYDYRVATINAAGISPYSNIKTKTVPTSDTTKPSVPQNLRQSAMGANLVTVTWDASTDNVGIDGYDVYVNPVPGTGYVLSIGNVTSYTISDAVSGVIYEMLVRARDAAGNVSNWSNLVDALVESDHQAETVTFRNMVEADGGKIWDLSHISDVLKWNKDQLLYTSLQFLVSRRFAYKESSAGQTSKIYDLSSKGNHVDTVLSGTGTASTLPTGTELYYDFRNSKYIKDASANVTCGDEFTFYSEIKHQSPDTQGRNYFFGLGNATSANTIAFNVGGNISVPERLAAVLFSATTKQLEAAQGTFNNLNDANIHRDVCFTYKKLGTSKIYKDGISLAVTNAIDETIADATIITYGRRADGVSETIDSDSLLNKTVFYNKQITDTQLAELRNL